MYAASNLVHDLLVRGMVQENLHHLEMAVPSSPVESGGSILSETQPYILSTCSCEATTITEKGYAYLRDIYTVHHSAFLAMMGIFNIEAS